MSSKLIADSSLQCYCKRFSHLVASTPKNHGGSRCLIRWINTLVDVSDPNQNTQTYTFWFITYFLETKTMNNLVKDFVLRQILSRGCADVNDGKTCKILRRAPYITSIWFALERVLCLR